MKTTAFNPQDRNIIFVGLDCATHWIVKDLVAQGRMPVMANIIESGTTFRTETEEPVMSPVVWTSIASSKVPEKHGVKSFHATSASVKTKRIWDIFLDRGSKIGIMGHFVIWPLAKVNGFMVPDLMALDDQTYPKELSFLRRLTESSKAGRSLKIDEALRMAKTAAKYGVQISTFWSGLAEILKSKLNSRSIYERQFSVRYLKQRLYGDVFVKLYKMYSPQYAYFHNHFIDTCSHIFWKYVEPDKFGDVSESEIKKYENKLFEAYEHADKTLGKIWKLSDENTLFVVASDHGAKAAASEERNWRIPNINTEHLMQTLEIEKEVSYSNVGLDVIAKPRIETEGNKERLKELFDSITIVEDNMPLFQIAEKDSSNIWLSLNNSITEVEDRHIKINNCLYELERFVHVSKDRTSGVHDGSNAMLVLSGKGVKKSLSVKNSAKVLDIIPTILALTGLPIGRDMDGEVLLEAMEEDFLQKYPVEFIESYDDPDQGNKSEPDLETSEELKSRLRALGYL
jgi:hypothetical protein